MFSQNLKLKKTKNLTRNQDLDRSDFGKPDTRLLSKRLPKGYRLVSDAVGAVAEQEILLGG